MASCLFVLCAIGLVAAQSQDIYSLQQLNARLHRLQEENREVPPVGVLSRGNFDAVANELHGAAHAEVYLHAEDLYRAVANGTAIAGLVSGTVAPPSGIAVHVFPSEQISLRAMLVRPGNTAVLAALDAALVRVIDDGGVEACAASNPPYRALVAHSCMADVDRHPWPNRSALPDTLRVAALGPYFWGKADGDYTVSPFTGFWPCLYDRIGFQFEEQYPHVGNQTLELERVWYPTSGAVLNAVLEGAADTTEPYMMVGAAFDATQTRKGSFDLSCITSASQDQYFTQQTPKPKNDVQPQSASDGRASTVTIVAACLAAGTAVAAVAMVVLMRHRERTGNPIFQPLSTTDSMMGTSDSSRGAVQQQPGVGPASFSMTVSTLGKFANDT